MSPFTWRLVLLSYTIISISIAGYIECLTISSCEDQTLDCASNEDCVVTCGGASGPPYACKNATINCANGYDCTVDCIRYQGCDDIKIHGNNANSLTITTSNIGGEIDSLKHASIYCGNVNYCEVECSPIDNACQGLLINAEAARQLIFRCDGDQSDHCRDSTILCPTNTPTCWIYGPAGISNLVLYAEMGFNGVEICGPSNSVSIGIMNCETGYGQPCTIDQSDPNICQSFSSCDDSDTNIDMNCTVPPLILSEMPSDMPSDMPSNNPSVNPSNNPSVNPTNNPSENPTNNPSENPSNIPSRNPTNAPSNDQTPETSIVETSTTIDNQSSKENDSQSSADDTYIYYIIVGVLLIMCCCLFGCIWIYKKMKSVSSTSINMAQINDSSQPGSNKSHKIVKCF